MSMRRILLLALISVSVIAVFVNSLIFSSLTDKYFRTYMKESYVLHTSQIVDYSKRALLSEMINTDLIALELEVHLIDPITRIRLYTPEGTLISDVKKDYPVFDEMAGRMMMRFMMGPLNDEIDVYPLSNEDEDIGSLYITRYAKAEDSYIVLRFKSSLFRNSLLAAVIAAGIAIMLGISMSRKTTKALKETMQSAQAIRLGEIPKTVKTGMAEIDEIRSSLDSLYNQLKLRQKSRKTMTDSLIHKARTPLTILKTHLEAMQDGLTNDLGLEYKICHEQIDELTGIIENLGGIIDAERKSETPKYEKIDADRYIKRIVLALKTQFDKKGIELSYEGYHHLTLITDLNKLEGVIYNLLNNAYKYTHQGGRVKVALSVLDKWVEISVEDTGIGMDEETTARIFDAYYRGPDASSVPGDGLGLYIAKQDIDSLKGEISVVSKPDGGSRFVIRVPIEYDKE